MGNGTWVEFWRLDKRKTILTAILLGIGFITYMAYLLSLASGKIVLGKTPHPAVIAFLTVFSPIFGIGITYLLIFHTMPLFVAAVINISSILQFFYWYYLSCCIVWIWDRFFKK